jgi:4-amino-4-deoxy-L-arabinose transferase-like glycosyltransferase
MMKGEVPYRDLFDNKPPVVFVWYALSFMLFGEDVAAPRIIAAVLLSFTTLSLFTQVRLLFPRGVAYLAAALFALSTGLPYVALHANTEAYLLFPLVTSLLAFTMGIRTGSSWWYLASGILGGLAIMTKQVAVWNLVALAGVALWWQWRKTGGGWKAGAPSAYLFAGSALATAVVALPFAFTGAFDDFVYANLTYNYKYVGVISSAHRLFLLKRTVLFFLFFSAVAAPLVIGAIFGLLTVLRIRKSFGYYLFIFWALACALGVATGGRFYPHYFLELLPVLAVLTAIVVYDRFRMRRLRPVPRLALLASAVFVGVSLTTSALLYFAPRGTEQAFSEDVYYQKEWEDASQRLGAYIQARTDPDDRIFNYGHESQIYFYADRLPAAPHFYDWAFLYDDKALAETIDVLRQEPPVYIIDSVQPPLHDMSERSPAFGQFLRERYEYVGHIYFADVYRLKAGH